MDAHAAMGTQIVYEAEDVSLHGLTGDKPRLRYHKGGEQPRDRMRFHRRLRRLPRRQPAGDPAGGDPHLRARLSVRLARHAVGHAARQSRADLHQPRARLCAVHHALHDAQPLLSAGARGRGRGRLVGRPLLDRAQAPHPGRRRGRAADRAHRWRRAWRRCARSWPSRCATAGCSSPAMPPTSCRPPAPRASTSPSPTCAS